MKEPMISNEWIDKILGSSQEKLYQEGYQRGLKHCHDEGGEEYYVPFFAEGFVQGYAEQMLVNMCQLAKKQNIPLSEIAESYQVTERELIGLYTALVSENNVNIQ